MRLHRVATVPRTLEKTEQGAGCQLLLTIGAAVYVLGTRRPKGEDQSTRQTPGISDVITFLPRTKGVLFWEAKAAGGRMSPEQAAFRTIVTLCARAGLGIHHVLGGCNALTDTLSTLGLLKETRVAHDRLEASAFTAPAVGETDATPAAIQAVGAQLGREQRARRRRTA